MSFAIEGNAYLDESYVLNSSIGTSVFTGGVIRTSSIDMLNTAGNYQNITNAAMPIQNHDVVIKLYVDNLGIVINDITLTQTNNTSIGGNNSGSYTITVTNLVLNGPSGTFHITKNDVSISGHVNRITACPGSGTPCLLNITWPSYSTPLLSKTSNSYDGSYRVKII
jgi:hypothetical protein